MSPRSFSRSMVCGLVALGALAAAPVASADTSGTLLGVDVAGTVDAVVAPVVAPIVAPVAAPATAPAPAPAPAPAAAPLVDLNLDLGAKVAVGGAPAPASGGSTSPRPPLVGVNVDLGTKATVGGRAASGTGSGGTSLVGVDLDTTVDAAVGGTSLAAVDLKTDAAVGVGGGSLLDVTGNVCASVVLLGPASAACTSANPTTPTNPTNPTNPTDTTTTPQSSGNGAGTGGVAFPIGDITSGSPDAPSSANGAAAEEGQSTLASFGGLANGATLPFTGAQLMQLVLAALVLLALGLLMQLAARTNLGGARTTS